MSNSSCNWSLKKWCWGILPLIPLLFLCERYLDVPLALLVQEVLYGDSGWARHTSHLPDLLLPLVVVVTAVTFPVYLIRRRHGVHDRLNLLLQVVAWTTPCSYLLKGTLKHIFGRINTREWLRHPEMYGFHWLRGGEGFEGFPSGHMLVLVALAAALWRFYPRHRQANVIVMTLLAAALIATNYHFLSDVIAGAYLAVGLEGVLFKVIVSSQEEPGLCREG
ncbi:phosphatase PAP2 family protein [Geomonas sp. RF6]|uniref:phosphatase PAP2 family protein n=1 Tax=Geomonas sp. RF6 TaxID=2897342 RepID=UPI001E627F33|nr:phosphatase PAP2 family protein [Geomonas sp. RF6]UFS71210.1 phosphatase PAP2 family protein [Geomonas sp. RF6]